MSRHEREAAAIRFALAPATAWAFAPRDWSSRRSRLDRVGRVTRMAPGIRLAVRQLGGIRAELMAPENPREDLVVLYLHGGGWTLGSPRPYRGLTSRLAHRLRANVWVIDYRLAPEHRYPAALDDCVAAYGALLEQGHTRIAVAGDSAGGNLTVALALVLRAAGLPAPVALGLICPVLDLTPDAVARLRDSSREPLLTSAVTGQMVTAYVGEHPRTDPLVSPILGDLSGLPPLVLDSSADDILAAQALEFGALVREAGRQIDHRHYQRRWHVFHVLVGFWPAASEAVDGFADRLDAAARRPVARPRASGERRRGQGSSTRPSSPRRRPTASPGASD